MTDRISLDDHLEALDAAAGLKTVLRVVAAACVDIRKVVAQGALVGALGASGAVNVQDEEQKKLDVISNDILTEALLALPRHGMINVHASLLPRYRGAAPIHRAIVAGEGERDDHRDRGRDGGAALFRMAEITGAIRNPCARRSEMAHVRFPALH